jgi:hypothetical protein
MANESVELTLTGLCVLVIQGGVGDLHPRAVEILMVDGSGGEHPHVPRLSARAIDLEDVTGDSTELVDILVAPDGEEIIDLPIPPRDTIDIAWEFGPANTQFTMAWDGSSTSMLKVPDLLDFNVKEVFLDGTNTAAKVNLPFGSFEARRIARGRDGEILWRYKGETGAPHVFANQVTLVSEAALGANLNVTLGGRTFSFLSRDAELPLRIGLTNLPSQEQLVEPPIGAGQAPAHLTMYKKIMKTGTGSAFRVFERAGPFVTKQGGICPAVRIHV